MTMWGRVDAQQVLQALGAMRPAFASYEQQLHQLVQQALTAANLPWQHEVLIGRGCRVDYLIGSVALEIKKGKPEKKALLRQLQRYAGCEGVQELIVVCPYTLHLPPMLMDKPLYTLALQRLWGVALF